MEYKSIKKIRNAFIVQEIIFEKTIDEKCEEKHYFEAWEVKDGECKKDELQECHDLFCVGNTYDSGDALKASIGHKGKISFVPRVFIVKEEIDFYKDIQCWPTDEVREANGLKACYYLECVAKKVYENLEFFREPFYHEWTFDDPELIFKVVLRYCQIMYHQNNKNDRTNFYIAIDDLFPDGVYPEVKRKVIEAWKS